MEVSWTEIKNFADQRSISIQWIDISNRYYLCVYDGNFSLSSNILKTDPASDEQIDFETNYKSNGNKPIPSQQQPFSSKSLPNGKNLYKRFTGISQSLTSGSNTFTWTQASFPWAKFLGIEVLGAELGDTCSLYVLDTATGTFSGHANYPLNQFAFAANIAPIFYKHKSNYDADIWQNLQIKFVYNSVSNKTIYINFDMNEVK